jgi:hypothetical protein
MSASECHRDVLRSVQRDGRSRDRPARSGDVGVTAALADEATAELARFDAEMGSEIACGCRKWCRGCSCGVSVLVYESVTSGRPGDVELAQRGGRDALYRENPLPARTSSASAHPPPVRGSVRVRTSSIARVYPGTPPSGRSSRRMAVEQQPCGLIWGTSSEWFCTLRRRVPDRSSSRVRMRIPNRTDRRWGEVGRFWAGTRPKAVRLPDALGRGVTPSLLYCVVDAGEVR